MKIQLFLLLTLFGASSLANTIAEEWQIKEQSGKYRLELKSNPKVMIFFEVDNVKPKVVFTSPLEKHPDIDLVVVFTGRMGTSEIVDFYQAAIYDNKSKKILSIAPYKYTQMGRWEKPLPQNEQPQWQISSNKITVTSQMDSLKKEILLPKPK
jgi:hypothetical protein